MKRKQAADDAAEEDTMGVGWWMTALLLCCLTGIKCDRDAAFVYGRIGGHLLLPCANLLLSDCSSISWTFFKSGGSWISVDFRKDQPDDDSQKSNGISITSNCSLSLRDLQEENAGSYTCYRDGTAMAVHYLSLLAITSVSTITSLQPGGNLSLNCVLFTYYDTGNCRYYSTFNLSWVSEDGTTLPSDNRTRLVDNTRCNVTLVTHLEAEDNNRKWRCQVNTNEEAGVVFLDFRSAFLFDGSVFGTDVIWREGAFGLPITRILFFALVTLAVVVVAVAMWRRDKDGEERL